MLLHSTSVERENTKGVQQKETEISVQIDFSLEVMGKDFKQGTFQRNHAIHSWKIGEGAGIKSRQGKNK